MTVLDTRDGGDFKEILREKVAEATTELKTAIEHRADADKQELRDELEKTIADRDARIASLESEMRASKALGGMVPGVEKGMGEPETFSVVRALRGIYLEKKGQHGIWETKEYGYEGEYFREMRAQIDGLPSEQKAMYNTGVGAEGAFTVDTTLIPGILDHLRQAPGIYQMGARRLDGLTSDIEWVRNEGGTTATWFGSEVEPPAASPGAIIQSESTFATVSATPKSVGALSFISWLMLKQPAESIEQHVRNEIATVLAEEENSVAFTGGGANQPTGIRNTAGILDNTVDFDHATDVDDPVVILDFWRKFAQLLRTNKALGLPGARLGYVVEDVVAQNLEVYTTVNDKLPFFISNDQLAIDSLFRVPLRVELDADFSGGGTDRTCLFGDFNQAVICHWGGLQLDATDSHQHQFANAVLAIRGIQSMDVAILQPKAFATSSAYSDT